MKKWIFILFIIISFPFAAALWVWWQIPSEKEIRGCIVTQMFQVNLCPKNTSYVRLKDISTHLQKSVVLTEDSLFWQHQGFDWDSIKKNYEENKKAGRYRRGGSTISQQLAKNMFLTSEKTLIRKMLEALITIRIERYLTKKEILERYLNVIEFGKNIYGIKQASQHYFKKHPSQLSIVESAFLVMLLPNPKKYSASFYRKELTPFAAKRIRQIINNLYQFQRISEEQYSMALVDLETFFTPQLKVDTETEVEDIDLNTLTLEKLEIESEIEDRF
ncbi:MAG: monofunctional biosynthetic peptidoglycan transglycosylase [Bdellovibrionales bacterium]